MLCAVPGQQGPAVRMCRICSLSPLTCFEFAHKRQRPATVTIRVCGHSGLVSWGQRSFESVRVCRVSGSWRLKLEVCISNPLSLVFEAGSLSEGGATRLGPVGPPARPRSPTGSLCLPSVSITSLCALPWLLMWLQLRSSGLWGEHFTAEPFPQRPLPPHYIVFLFGVQNDCSD